MIELLIIALVVFGYALVSERLSTSPVTAPIMFTTVGIVVGTGGSGWFARPAPRRRDQPDAGNGTGARTCDPLQLTRCWASASL